MISRPQSAVRHDQLISTDTRWIVPAAALVLCQYGVAIVVGSAVGEFSHFPTLKYMLIALVISLLGGSLIAAPRVWRYWREREPHPIARLLRESEMNAIATYLFGFQLVALEMGALTWLKDMLPAAIPYWADPILASLDRSIFGTDPWRVVPEILIRPLDGIYATWMAAQTLALIFVLCLRPTPKKARAMLAWFLIVGVMGVCGQYLLSSAGPVFYDRVVGGDTFAGLMSRIAAHAKLTGMAENFLWASYTANTDQIGNGISAMPSIHVATSTWIALALSSVRPKLRIVGWGYWLAIFIGSFALGWHYFLDSAVGTGGAVVCWVVARRLLAREPRKANLAISLESASWNRADSRGIYYVATNFGLGRRPAGGD
jgi:hypothetical protein